MTGEHGKDELIAELLAALQRMDAMHERMMKQANHAKSFYDAETVFEMTAAPCAAARVIQKAMVAGYEKETRSV